LHGGGERRAQTGGLEQRGPQRVVAPIVLRVVEELGLTLDPRVGRLPTTARGLRGRFGLRARGQRNRGARDEWEKASHWPVAVTEKSSNWIMLSVFDHTPILPDTGCGSV